MESRKTFEQLHARFPNSRIRDGTLKKLKGSTLKIFLVLSAFKNYNTNESKINYETIREYTGITDGTRILESIQELVDAKLIATTIFQKRKMNGKLGQRLKRIYEVKDNDI